MDYPISVPSIGLVGGKFADEDPLAGTPGSLIPAQWGNAVTDEIRNVIIAAGLTPDEMLNNQLASAIALIIGAARPLASQAEAEAGTENTKVMTSLRTAQAILKRLPSIAPVVGTSRNVRCGVSAPSATATFTADELVLKASLGGMAYTLSAFNKTINLASVGAGGMDTGLAPVSGFVSIYAIYNPTTQASALLACDQAVSSGHIYTGSNMPSGYTASALVSAWGTNASRLLAAGSQLDQDIDVNISTILNTTAVFTNAPTNLNSILPVSAKEISGIFQCGAASSNVNSTIGLSSTPQGFGSRASGATSVSAGAVTQSSFSGVKISTSRTVYFSSSVGSGSLAQAAAYLTSYKI